MQILLTTIFQVKSIKRKHVFIYYNCNRFKFTCRFGDQTIVEWPNVKNVIGIDSIIYAYVYVIVCVWWGELCLTQMYNNIPRVALAALSKLRTMRDTVKQWSAKTLLFIVCTLFCLLINLSYIINIK